MISPIFQQYVIVVVVNLTIICAGMSLNWTSPVLVKLMNETQEVLPEPLTEEQASWVTSIGYLVAVFTSLSYGLLMDCIGRKSTVICCCILRIIMIILFVFANAVWMLLLGRVIGALADTMNMAVSGVYASEIASKQIRGALGTFLQLFAAIGILIILSMGPFVSYLNLNIIFAVIILVTSTPILFLPESPYFLYSKGRKDDALNILIQLRGSVEAANEEIEEYTASSETIKVNKRDLFKNRTFLKTFLITIIIGFGLQAIGFNAIFVYLQTILESTQTNIRDELGSVIIGFIQLAGACTTAIILDRFGRKPILGLLIGVMVLGMFGMGVFFYIRDNSDSDTVSGVMNFVPLISLIFVVFGYNAGPGSIFWLLVAELYEGPGRAIGMSCFVTISTLTIFLITRFFANLTNILTPAGTYWLFGSIGILFNAFLMIVVPETKGKSFAEIQLALGAKETKVTY